MTSAVGGLRVALTSGALRPPSPIQAVAMARAVRRAGWTPATLLAVTAARYPQRTAIVDDDGAVPFVELDRSVEALAGALHARFGLGPGSRIGVLARNHRGFAESFLAATRIGADVVPLNPELPAPVLGEILARERVDLLLHDDLTVPDVDGVAVKATFRALNAHKVAFTAPQPPAPRRTPGAIVIMTSGTTGTPKGAPRRPRASGNPLSILSLLPAGLHELARLGQVPRSGQPIVVAPPLHHVFGLGALLAGLAYGSPVVLHDRFDAERTLAAVHEHRAGVLGVVPTMLKRILDLPPETLRRYDTGSLRMVLTGGSALPPELGERAMDHFGEVLFNAYASTEVGPVTLATPADLRAAPGTVGYPARFVSLRLLDDSGEPVPPGATGRIFVKHPFLFAGYSGGGGKEVIDGHMSIGDVGHLDADGRLFVDGRDDDMIVSGGENVYPQAVEDLLLTHPAVADAAAIGVPDEEFGQRLLALVVKHPQATEDAAELREYVRAKLARYQVPREVRFVAELPRTSTGKLRRKALRDIT